MVDGREVGAAELMRSIPKKPKRVSDGSMQRVYFRADATRSLGFLVAGFSVRRLEEAKRDHEAARQAAIDHNLDLADWHEGRKPLPPRWDESQFMAKARPTRVRQKPYDNLASAEVCATIARRDGWLGVTVTEELRG